MAKQFQYRRLLAMAVLLGAAFTGLGYRLVDLQVLRHEDLSRKAQKETQHIYHLEPRRGDIVDIKGNLLATSVFVKTVCADPALIGDHQAEVARALAPLLQMNEAELTQRLMPRPRLDEKGRVMTNGFGKPLTNHYVVLKHKVSEDAWQKISETMAKMSFGADEKRLSLKEKAFLKGLRENAIATDPADNQLRVYPNQSLAAHVLGYVGMAERANNSVQAFELAGVDGIERVLDDKLKGAPGWRLTGQDSHAHELVALREENVEPRDGLKVVLTIDSVIQNIVETALAEGLQKSSPASVSGLVIRPRTGEILALATLPNFDPNNLDGAPPEARRNRVIADMNEPGSTFKIIVISSALSDHTVKLTDEFDCGHGHFYFAGRELHDHEPSDVLSVKGIITRSSNIGAAKVGIQMGAERLYEHIVEYGLTGRTGIPLPGESGGNVHSVKNWTKVSIAQIPMGQGAAVTSLQMAMAMCAIANKGVLMRPMLVDRLVDPDGNAVARYSPQPVRRVISEEADHDMIEALKTVVTPEGTGAKAALEHYTVAGKTGTGQKAPYTSGKFYASFIGFFPADNPEVCIYVSMDDPKGHLHQGGQVAAPVFKQIAEKVATYLNIRPDDGADPTLPDAVAGTESGPPIKTASAHSP
ncbi:MAG TPA: penicillin-binding protein 2 [Verrucomicrobiae bacterium]|nr:penicillin-binding protein 2 [Verrucomicrobiae bacterium]